MILYLWSAIACNRFVISLAYPEPSADSGNKATAGRRTPKFIILEMFSSL